MFSQITIGPNLVERYSASVMFGDRARAASGNILLESVSLAIFLPFPVINKTHLWSLAAAPC